LENGESLLLERLKETDKQEETDKRELGFDFQRLPDRLRESVQNGAILTEEVFGGEDVDLQESS
jgi:hypothetical protein